MITCLFHWRISNFIQTSAPFRDRVRERDTLSSWGLQSEFMQTAGQHCLIRLVTQAGPPPALHAEQPPSNLWPLASHRVLILPSASGSTAVAAEWGILGPQLGFRVPTGLPWQPSSREPGTWHWCGWTAAEGEGSRRCYLWGNANKWFKNVWQSCQTFFISWCHSNWLRHIAWLAVGKKRRWVIFVLLHQHIPTHYSHFSDSNVKAGSMRWFYTTLVQNDREEGGKLIKVRFVIYS